MPEKTIEERVAELEAGQLRLRKAAAKRFRRLEADVDDAQRAAKAAQSSADDAESKAEEAAIEAQDAAA